MVSSRRADASTSIRRSRMVQVSAYTWVKFKKERQRIIIRLPSVRYGRFVAPSRSRGMISMGMTGVRPLSEWATDGCTICATVYQAVIDDRSHIPAIRPVGCAISHPGYVLARPGKEILSQDLEWPAVLGVNQFHVCSLVILSVRYSVSASARLPE